jgi:PAB1-binding protein PBP1
LDDEGVTLVMSSEALEERPLMKMKIEGMIDSLDDFNYKEGSYDQFEMNKRFGYVKSTYKDELYTTALNENEISAEIRKKAIQIENEFKFKGGRA